MLFRSGISYYFGTDGVMQHSKWISSDGNWLYLTDSGTVATNKWIPQGGYWYYVDANGFMATGQIRVDGASYYFNANGTMATDLFFGIKPRQRQPQRSMRQIAASADGFHYRVAL